MKTTKTASTSLEMALGRYCEKEDIVTPIWGDGHDHADGALVREGRNYKKSLNEHSLRDLGSLMYRGARQIKFRNHEPATGIRNKLGEEIWRSYFKFTVVRNPYDRAVSAYYWDTRNVESRDRPSLFDWICENPWFVNETWRLCSDGTRLLMDDFIRYESLAEDFARIVSLVGLPEEARDAVRSQRMKAGQRPRNTRYEDVVDEKSRELISLLCSKEIAHFRYTF